MRRTTIRETQAQIGTTLDATGNLVSIELEGAQPSRDACPNSPANAVIFFCQDTVEKLEECAEADRLARRYERRAASLLVEGCAEKGAEAGRRAEAHRAECQRLLKLLLLSQGVPENEYLRFGYTYRLAKIVRDYQKETRILLVHP